MSDKREKPGAARHRGADHSSPYPVSRLAPPTDLVDLARQISSADAMVNARASAKLKVIADQIRALQNEARAVLEETRRDQKLHHARCNLKRRPGQIYHLYEKPGGELYFSLLSPDDWRGKPPDHFEGSYRLENDMSWTPADRLDEPDDTGELVRRLLGEDGAGQDT